MINLKTKIQSECLEAVKDYSRAGVVLGTGTGKTLLGIKHMAKQWDPYALFLVVAPKVSVFNEWQKQCIEHGFEYLIDNIEFTTYLSLNKKNPSDYRHIYLDECHNLKFSHDKFLRNYHKGIIGLTGTYPVYQSDERYKMCEKYCPIKYEYNVTEGIEDDILNDYTIILHPLNLSNDYNIPTSKGKMMSEQSIYNMWSNMVANAAGKQKQMNSIIRMKKIQSFTTKINYIEKMLKAVKDEKVLVFMESKENCQKISKHTYFSGNKKSDQNLELFAKGDVKVLTTIKQLAEGINIPKLKIGIIQHAYANERLLPQKVGRFLRLNPQDKAIIHILYYKNTIDEEWLKSSLKHLNHKNIKVYGKTTSSHQ